MSKLAILYDLRREIQKSVAEIRAANDYDTACSLWKSAYDHVLALRGSNILSQTAFQICLHILDSAIID